MSNVLLRFVCFVLFCWQVRGRASQHGRDNNRSSVSSVEEEGNAALPQPLLEQPEGAPPLSELSASSLALIVDGPSLVSFFSFA